MTHGYGVVRYILPFGQYFDASSGRRPTRDKPQLLCLTERHGGLDGAGAACAGGRHDADLGLRRGRRGHLMRLHPHSTPGSVEGSDGPVGVQNPYLLLLLLSLLRDGPHGHAAVRVDDPDLLHRRGLLFHERSANNKSGY